MGISAVLERPMVEQVAPQEIAKWVVVVEQELLDQARMVAQVSTQILSPSAPM
jgi:hypothetical protein